MFVLAKRIIRQIFQDKRSFIILIFVPILYMTLLFFLLGESFYTPTVAMDKSSFPPSAYDTLNNSLENNSDIVYSLLPENTDITQFLEDKKVDAVITMKDNTVEIIMLEMVGGKFSIVQKALMEAVPKIPQALDISVQTIYGSTNATTFDSLAYFLLGVLSFFLIFIFSGVSFVRERTLGTLERLMRTPISNASVVAGYVLGFGFFVVFQTILLIPFTKYVLNTVFVGQLWLAILIMLLIAFVAVLMGIFVSVISKSEFQVVQSIPIVVISQIFFSGLIPVDMIPFHLDTISYFMPLYYGSVGLKYTMIYGYGIDKVWPYIFILIGFIVLLFMINVMAVKKSRRS